MNIPKPIFILSLPRSGSTLAQRIIGAHPSIATVAEPWFLLPHLAVLKADGVLANYDAETAALAINDVLDQIEDGKTIYISALRKFSDTIYTAIADDGAEFFLDKTPRYSLVSTELHDLYPDGKYIYLWRNPLSVIASSIQTWGKRGRWNIHRMYIDLYVGLPNLIKSYQENHDKVAGFMYESLVAEPENWRQLFDFIGVEWDSEVLSNFNNVDINGTMGDKTGRKAYKQLTAKGVNKWKGVINNPLRKAWCKRYLRWLGRNRLEVMGYDFDELIKEIQEVPNSYEAFISDLFVMIYGVIYRYFDLPVLKKQLNTWLSGRKVVAHR